MIEDIGTDEILGYRDGQRMAHMNPYLRGEGLRNVGLHRLREASRLLTLNEKLFIKGFKQGYQDELDGTAHPLPEEGRIET